MTLWLRPLYYDNRDLEIMNKLPNRELEGGEGGAVRRSPSVCGIHSLYCWLAVLGFAEAGTLEAVSPARDLRVLVIHGVNVAGCDDYGGCSSSDACAPEAGRMPCDTLPPHCASIDEGRPSFAYTGTGDLGTGRIRPESSAYCSPDRSFTVYNSEYFASPICADGFQRVTEFNDTWPPPSGASYAQTTYLPAPCRAHCSHGGGGHAAPPRCSSFSMEITGPAPPAPPVPVLAPASQTKAAAGGGVLPCEMYRYAPSSSAKKACYHTCLTPAVALAAGLTEKGTCDDYGYNTSNTHCCQTNTELTRLHGNITATICDAGDPTWGGGCPVPGGTKLLWEAGCLATGKRRNGTV